MSRGWLFAVALAAAVPAAAAPVPRELKYRVGKENTNALVKAHRDGLRADASSEWQGWPVAHAVDGDPATAWYSNSGDAPMNGAAPWVRVAFPADVTVRRATVLGSRDPNYPTGYFVLAGRFELLDAGGAVLASREVTAAGDHYDLDWVAGRAVPGVRAVRFTATKDQGTSQCVAVGEFQVE